MARSFSLGSALYQPGVYGPFSVNGFTKANTERMIAEVSRAALDDWPDVPLLFSVSIVWDTGGSVTATFSGRPTNRDGTPKMLVSLAVSVPRQDGVSRDVASGTITVEVHAECRAAVALRAE